MALKKYTIECTEKQYEVVRAIINSLVYDLKTRESYTKQKHCSIKNEKFYVSVPWKKVRLLQHLKEKMK